MTTRTTCSVGFCNREGALCSGTYPAYFGAGTKLTVLDGDVTPPEVRILPPSKKECTNERQEFRQKKTLVCVAHGFYPDHVKVYWKIQDMIIKEEVATDSDAVPVNGIKKTYRITSRLRVSAEEWFEPTNVFTCLVDFFDGKETTTYNASITGTETPDMKREKYLWITGNAKLSYVVLIVKSCMYGAFVWFLAWKLQKGPPAKRNAKHRR